MIACNHLVKVLDKSSGLLVEQYSGDISGDDLFPPQPCISPLPNPMLAAVTQASVNRGNVCLTFQHC